MLPLALDVEDASDDDPLVVVEIDRNHTLASLLPIDTGKVGGLLQHRQVSGAQFLVLRNRQCFDDLSREMCRSISKALLDGLYPGLEEDLLDLGLTLDPADPMVNALRVAHAPADRRTRVQVFAKASIRDAKGRAIFAQFVEALNATDASYGLVYDGEPTRGGGFDVNVGAVVFEALASLHKLMRSWLRSQFGALSFDVSPRLATMTTGSARLAFSTSGTSANRSERVARHLELRALERLLRGEQPSELALSPALRAALEQLVEPAPGMSLSQIPLGSQQPELVRRRDSSQEAAISRSRPFTVLGYQSGSIRDAAEIELTISPRLIVRVSATDNGQGDPPEGVEPLCNTSHFSFRPAVFTLARYTSNDGAHHFRLVRVESLRPGERRRLTAIPSSIVDGAFLLSVHLDTWRAHEDELSLGNLRIEGLASATRPAAKVWLAQYAKACAELELVVGAGDDVAWLAPPTLEFKSIHRLILALGELGGEAPIQAVVGEINHRFNSNVRTNNTRREVLRNPTLLEFAGEKNRSVRLTARGTAWWRVLRAVAAQFGEQ